MDPNSSGIMLTRLRRATLTVSQWIGFVYGYTRIIAQICTSLTCYNCLRRGLCAVNIFSYIAKAMSKEQNVRLCNVNLSNCVCEIFEIIAGFLLI